jgi:hypothetical protein
MRFSVLYYVCCGLSALTSSRPGLFLYEMGLSCKEGVVFLVYLVCVWIDAMRSGTGQIGKLWSRTDRCTVYTMDERLGLENYSRAVTSCANFVRFKWTRSLDFEAESTCLLLQVSTKSSLEMLRTTVEEWQKAAWMGSSPSSSRTR